jgi:hypothetical protein
VADATIARVARGETVDVEAILGQPLVARVATNGPTLRPVWFLWEESALWWITDVESALAHRLVSGDDEVVVVVDSCDLTTGEVVAVTMRGIARVVPLEVERAKRKFRKYLGPDEGSWDHELLGSLDASSTRLVRLAPSRVIAKDMSFRPSRHA